MKKEIKSTSFYYTFESKKTYINMGGERAALLSRTMPKTTIEFGEDATRVLSTLATNMGTTKADVLRNALTLYDYLLDQMGAAPGRALGIINEQMDNRVEKIIAVPGLARRTSFASSR